MAQNKNPFFPIDGETWVEQPDGNTRTYADGDTRNGLYDARFVSNYCGDARGYGAFRGEEARGPLPLYDDESRGDLGTTTGARSDKPVGRQR